MPQDRPSGQDPWRAGTQRRPAACKADGGATYSITRQRTETVIGNEFPSVAVTVIWPLAVR